jgi:hypothetical protein
MRYIKTSTRIECVNNIIVHSVDSVTVVDSNAVIELLSYVVNTLYDWLKVKRTLLNLQ